MSYGDLYEDAFKLISILVAAALIAAFFLGRAFGMQVGPADAPSPNPQRARVAAVAAYASMVQTIPPPAPQPNKPPVAPAKVVTPSAVVTPPKGTRYVTVTSSNCANGLCTVPPARRRGR